MSSNTSFEKLLVLKITKSVKQKYQFQDKQLFEDFRWMINEVIRIGIESRVTSKLALRDMVYDRFKSQYNTFLINTAAFKAHTILKNYRKMFKRKHHVKKPYVKKNFIVIEARNMKITGNYIHFSVKPRQFTAIELNHYVVSKISSDMIKIGDMIIRENEIVIPYSYYIQEKKTDHHIGIDMNFKNITTFDGQKEEVYDMSGITDYKERIQKTLSHFTRNDVRMQKKLRQKYGIKQRNKERNFLHNLTNKIISQKKIPVMENLKYIGKHGSKGNGKVKKFRFRLHSWSRFKIKHMIIYKSNENGLSSIVTNPKGTSSKCSACGAKMIPEENRLVQCSACGLEIDRDLNAARNIYNRGLRFGPVAQQDEGMKQSKDVDAIVVSTDVSQSPTS